MLCEIYCFKCFFCLKMNQPRGLTWRERSSCASESDCCQVLVAALLFLLVFIPLWIVSSTVSYSEISLLNLLVGGVVDLDESTGVLVPWRAELGQAWIYLMWPWYSHPIRYPILGFSVNSPPILGFLF